MGIDPAGNPGEKAAEAKSQQFVAGRVDARRPHRNFILPDCMEDDTDIGIRNFPHDGHQNEHAHHSDIVQAHPRTDDTVQTGYAELSAGYIRKGEDDPHQNNGEGQRGQGKIGAPESQAGDADDQARPDGRHGSERDTAPGWDTEVFVEQSGCVGADPEKKGMTEIHLAGKAGQQVPAGGKEWRRCWSE